MSVFVISNEILQAIKKIAPHIPIEGTAYPLKLDESVIKNLEKAEYLVTTTFSFPVVKDLIPNVKWIQSITAGVEHFVQPLKNSEITLSRFVGNLPQLMGEYVIGHIISHERNLRQTFQYQNLKQWGAHELMNYRRICNLSVCVLGFGLIGSQIAKCCKFFGMRVVAVKNNIKNFVKPPEVDEIYDSANMAQAMKGVDYVVNVLPSTNKTVNLLSGDVLSVCMGDPSAVFINIGRGNIIDEESIVRALKENWISGAILDVFEKEPLSPESPLWEMKNVYITPHVSGFSQKDEVAKEFVANYDSIQRGEMPTNIVNCNNEY